MEVNGYALSNIYEVYDGIDFFYNYSHIMNSTIKVAKRSENKNKNIVVIFPDTGSRYLSCNVFE